MANKTQSEHRARTEQAAIADLVERLTKQFPELPTSEIEQTVRGEYEGFERSAVRDFVPILVERSAKAELVRHRA